MEQKTTKNLRVLIGDDQIGVIGSLPNKLFARAYSNLADFDFESNPERFIKRAKVGKYNALLVDLHWKPEDYNLELKTGYKVLQAVKDFAPIRILHTSADEAERQRALTYGATDTAEKHKSREYLQEKLKGGVKNETEKS